MKEEIIIAGFGGQGVLSMGKILAYCAIMQDMEVTWMPSYGPEMRGGTANCNVIVSDEEVGSPIISSATALIVMNQPSLEKFENNVAPGGIVILDEDLVPTLPTRTDIRVFSIPATKMAYELGNATFAGIILLGKLIAETGVVKPESFEAALYGILKAKNHHLIPEEMKALALGAAYTK